MASSLTTSTTRDCVPGPVQLGHRARPRRYRSLAVVAALLLMAVVGAGCDWLQPGFDGGQSNFNPAEPALTANTVGSLTKQFSLVGAGAQVVVDGEIASQSVDSSGNLTVSTFDASTGAPRWTATPDTGVDQGVRTPMTSDGTNLFVAGQHNAGFCYSTNHVVALSAATGATAWDTTLSAGCLSNTALVTGDRLILMSYFETSPSFGTFNWTALDTRTGQVAWRYSQSNLYGTYTGTNTLTTATADGSVAITFFKYPAGPLGTVVLNAADGTQKWSITSASASTTALLYAGKDGLFFGRSGSDVSDFSTTDHLVAVDANTGAVKWDTSEGADPGQPGAITKNQVILGNENRLEALNIGDGTAQWVTPLPSNTTSVSHVVVAGNLIYVVTSDGTTATLRTYDVTTGAAVSSTPVASVATPTVAEGHVYLSTSAGLDAYAPSSS